MPGGLWPELSPPEGASQKGGGGGGGVDAELVLLSFAACAPLSGFERLHALDTTFTLGRLRSAASALERQRARLAAQVALRRAALGL